MMRPSLKFTAAVAVVFLLGFATFRAIGQEDQPDRVRNVVDERSGVELQIQRRAIDAVSLDRLTSETQQMADEVNSMCLVWWLPTEFWEASLRQDPTINADQVDEMVKPLRKYTMVAVVDGEMGAFGGVTYVSEREVRRSVSLKVGERVLRTPVAEADIEPNVRTILNVTKPMLRQMLGQLGQNMHFLVFEHEGDQPIVNPTGFDTLDVSVGERTFSFETPLPSLLRDKHCAKCGRNFRGDYSACPYDRTKLELADSQ